MTAPASVRPGRRAALTLASLLSIGSLGGSGCAYDTQLVSGDGWSKAQLEVVGELKDRIRVLEESLPLLACGPELRALFHDIRMECDNKSSAAPPPTPEKAEPGTCQAQQIDGRVFAAERDLGLTGRQRNMGMHLLSLLRHEVVYVGANGQISSRQDQRLHALASERRLPSTRFLIIASGGDVDLRARIVTSKLHSYGVPAKESVLDGGTHTEISRFERPWNYRLGVTFNQMTPVDRPTGPAEPRDIDRAVFVFRTDCL